MRPFVDKVMPEAWEAAVAFSSVIREGAARRGLSSPESELIKVRASQLNGCAFCLDLHSREARTSGSSSRSRRKTRFDDKTRRP